MTHLTISVVIPVHSRLEFLTDTLNSIYNQTRPVTSVIVVSDREDAKDFIDEFRGKGNLIYEEVSETMMNKLNYGMNLSTTDVIFWIADDDMIDSSYVEKAMGIMENLDVDIVYPDMKLFGIDNRRVDANTWELKSFQTTTGVYGVAIMKRKVWEDIQFQDMAYGDWDFWWTACEKGFTAYHLKEPLFLYRTHLEQHSRKCDVAEETRKVLERHNVYSENNS
jgi:glycosyltransferase involved in cell wall biosynthesis